MDTTEEVTVAEAAEILGVSLQHVRWYYRNGHLVGRRIGELMLMFPRSEVEKLRDNKPKKSGRPTKNTPTSKPAKSKRPKSPPEPPPEAKNGTPKKRAKKRKAES